ncbi:ABC transporter substrate-binding protein [Xylophilus sp. GOD-11R]|uniref:ABC transporter substrate-binding protein n=1 Tax=Xylophilus sp. GOD-11R TaxID=3089814 RepID=UPI00298BF825|nr:ABC transporter substrate-binding protein [Xylophilus sp. GOD-11R]WPB56645.1 ABC transporter substrate-binding protein [Xylophilus sp. GOD-11R]
MKSKLQKLASALAAATVLMAAATQAAELNFASGGGAYQAAIRDAWLKPFSKETGIKINEDTDPQVAKIKAMIDTKSVAWDVTSQNSARLARGVKLGVFEKITPDMVDQKNVIPGARNDYGVPTEIFATNIGFSTKAFPAGKPQPSTFADFWDVTKFPGKRTLQDDPSTVLEAALIADGVPPADVYKVLATPAGVDRAMKQIEKIKPHIAMWWKNGAEPVNALGSGEVVMALGWNGRFQAGMDSGLPISMGWGDSVAQVGYMALVKGAEHREEAIKLLNFITVPKNQAEFSKYIAYGPTTELAFPMIDEARKQRLPSTPERLKRAIFMDSEFWEKNGPAIVERYNAIRAR